MWRVLDKVKPATVVPPGPGNNTPGLEIGEVKDLMYDEIVFKLFFPIEEGIQYDSETPYPYTGDITKLFISIPKESIISSNYNIILQSYNRISNSWETVKNIRMNHGEYEKSVDVNSFRVNNTRLRLTINEGIVNTLDAISVLCTIKKIYND